jgi:Arc-like DNA binding domain.
MSKDTQQIPATYSVRLPVDMRRQLEEAARVIGRSLHAEILMRLGESLKEAPTTAMQDPAMNLNPDLRKRLKVNADTHGWTVEKEIAWRLEKSFEEERELEDQLAYEELLNGVGKAAGLTEEERFHYLGLLEDWREERAKEFNITYRPLATNGRYAASLDNLVRAIASEVVKEQFAKAGITIPDDNQQSEIKGD